MIRLLMAATLVSLAAPAAAVAVDPPPSGDAQALAFYRAMQVAYTHIAATHYSRTGSLSYAAAGGVFQYAFGVKPPSGLRPARESIVVLLSHGVIVRSVDTARASGLPALTVIGDTSGVWAKTADERCFRGPGYANPVSLFGHPIISIGSRRFAPLERAGAIVVIRSSFAWGGAGPIARQVDRVSATTKLLLSTTIQIAEPNGANIQQVYQVVPPPRALPTPHPHC